MRLVNRAVVFILVTVLVFFVGCKDNDNQKGDDADGLNLGVPKISSAYFPTAAGLYKKFEDAEGGWEERVLEPQEFEGEEVIPVKVHRLGKVNQEQAESIDLVNYTNYYRVTDDAVELVGMESDLGQGEVYADAVDPPWVIMSFGMQQGNEWIFEMMNPPGMVRVSVEGFEDVTTKAGTFTKAVKLKLESEFINEGGETERTTHFEWYAPGTGLVKIKGHTGERDAELVETRTVSIQ